MHWDVECLFRCCLQELFGFTCSTEYIACLCCVIQRATLYSGLHTLPTWTVVAEEFSRLADGSGGQASNATAEGMNTSETSGLPPLYRWMAFASKYRQALDKATIQVPDCAQIFMPQPRFEEILKGTTNDLLVEQVWSTLAIDLNVNVSLCRIGELVADAGIRDYQKLVDIALDLYMKCP